MCAGSIKVPVSSGRFKTPGGGEEARREIGKERKVAASIYVTSQFIIRVKCAQSSGPTGTAGECTQTNHTIVKMCRKCQSLYS